MGQQPAYAMDYLDATSWSSMESSAANEAAKWSSSGYTMTFSIPMLPDSGATLSGGAAGDYNSYFQQIAQGLVANNEASSILRIGWEFNGSWTPWYASASNASEFVSFWQQVVTAMRSVSGANFQFEWCPNGGDTRTTCPASTPATRTSTSWPRMCTTRPGAPTPVSRGFLQPRDRGQRVELAHFVRRPAG